MCTHVGFFWSSFCCGYTPQAQWQVRAASPLLDRNWVEKVEKDIEVCVCVCVSTCQAFRYWFRTIWNCTYVQRQAARKEETWAINTEIKESHISHRSVGSELASSCGRPAIQTNLGCHTHTHAAQTMKPSSVNVPMKSLIYPLRRHGTDKYPSCGLSVFITLQLQNFFFARARKHAANQHVAYSVWLEVEKMQRENNREGFTVCGNMHSSLQVYWTHTVCAC